MELALVILERYFNTPEMGGKILTQFGLVKNTVFLLGVIVLVLAQEKPFLRHASSTAWHWGPLP